MVLWYAPAIQEIAMNAESAAPPQIAAMPDPLSRRFAMCAIWMVVYGTFWWFKVFRPLPHVAWVNLAVLGAILVSTLPPARVRPFSTCASFLALGAIMLLVFGNTLYAIVLALCAVFALSDGLIDLRARRRARHRP
jgi:hypothetical protein